MKILFLFPLLLISASAAWGCSTADDRPVADDVVMVRGKLVGPVPQPERFVFLGRVIEIVTFRPSVAGGRKEMVEALRVSVEGMVNEPWWSSGGGVGSGSEIFDVMPLSVNPDCSLTGQTDLAVAYPVGSQVRVVGSESVAFKTAEERKIPGGLNLPHTAYPRVEVSLLNRGRISRNDLALGSATSTISFVYDYRDFAYKVKVSRESQTAMYSNREFLAFELQKDMARLAHDTDPGDRFAVMERLVYYPHLDELAFHRLAAGYLKPSRKRAVLERQWDLRKQAQTRDIQTSIVDSPTAKSRISNDQ